MQLCRAVPFMAASTRPDRISPTYYHSNTSQDIAWRGKGKARANWPSFVLAEEGGASEASWPAFSSCRYCSRVGAAGEHIRFQAA